MEDTGWFSGKPERGHDTPRSAPPVVRRSLRLTFHFDGDTIELAGVERLPMISPPQHGDEPEAGKHSGEWIVLCDRSGRTLAWRLLHDPLRTRVEVHDPDAGPRIVTGPPTSGVFEALLPDVPDGTRADLYLGAPARKLASFDLAPRGEEAQS
jgi:hypothetical protein